MFGVSSNTFVSPNSSSAYVLAAGGQDANGEGMYGPNTFDGSNHNNLQAGDI